MNTNTHSFQKGDTVRVKGTTHTSTITDIAGKWHELEQKASQHKYNAYGAWQLEKVEVPQQKEVVNG